MRFFLFAAAFSGLLAVGVTAQKTPQQPAAQQAWTVAVYLQADHNLDSSALMDLEEMTRAGPLKNVSVVYQLDRNDDVAASGVQRGVILNGKRKVVQRLPELNSDDPRNVASFVQWAYKAYPGRQRALIMWDHGGQWDGGFGGDEHGPGLKNGEAGTLTPEALAGALKTALGSKPLDVLAFDTCLMGGAELMAQFAPYARIFIANPELDYGDGWNYAPTLKFMNAQPNAPLKVFAQQEVKFWQAQHREALDDRLYAVHAAYDLSVWPQTQRAINEFAAALSAQQKNPALAGAFWRARAESIQYSYSTEDGQPGLTRPYVDLGHYAGKIAAFVPDAGLKAKAAALNRALSGLVIARSLGDKRQAASAVSIYFPTHRDLLPDQALLARYAKLPFNAGGQWNTFERQWVKTVQADQTPPQLKNVNLLTTNKDGTTTFEFTVGGADVYAVMASLYRNLGRGKYLDYGDIHYTRLTGGQYTFDWEPLTWTITDGKSTSLITADHGDPDDEFMTASALYATPDGDSFDVLVQFTDDGELIGVLDDSGESPTAIDVDRGGSFQFYLRTYDENTDEYDWKLQPQKLRIKNTDLSNLSADLSELPEGNFEIDFTAFDYAGNDTTELVEFSLK